MTRKKIYFDGEAPVNSYQLSNKIFDLVANAVDFNINIDDIPDPDKKEYPEYVLNLLFTYYTFISYVKFKKPNIKTNEQVECIVCDSKMPADMIGLVAERCTELVTKKDFKMIVAKNDKLIQTLGKTTVLCEIDNKKGKSRTDEIDLKIECLDEPYCNDLLDDKGLWSNYIIPKVTEAIHICRENECSKAKEKFKTDCIPDKQKFADALVIYCEIFRNLSDVHKCIEHYIAINKWIKGEPTKSRLLCMFNTDPQQGQNGKTHRMKTERSYMEMHGFATKEMSLDKNGCNNINDFGFHLYYKDEYDFSDTDANFLKSINLNTRPRITAKVMYVGNQSIENEAIIFLCCHNGKPAERIISSERTASTIRCTDALYENNKDKLTCIYEDQPDPNCKGRQISYIDLFDGLIKHACEYDRSKLIKKTDSLKVSTELLDVIEKIDKQTFSFNTLIRHLSRRQYKTKESAKKEVHELHNFLEKNYFSYFVKYYTKNWADRQISCDTETLLEILDNEIGNSITDVSDELIDKQELKNYIYSLFDLDPNAPVPVENTTTNITEEDEVKRLYDRYSKKFIPVTKTKLEKEYTDSKTGENFKLLYEGVNIPESTPTAGHLSTFSLDNMILMPRFLVEYDAPEGTSVEDIQTSKQLTKEWAEQMPTFRVVDSGNKSLHVMFLFDFESLPRTVEEYKFATQYAVQTLQIPSKMGLAELDMKVLKDPSRICRRPGVVRENGNMQTLISQKEQSVHIDWREAYENAKKAERQEKILKKSCFTCSISPSTPVETFIQNYVNKNNLFWCDGERHSTAAKIAGACNVAGYGESESIQAIENLFDCSEDPTITRNLGVFFSNP